MNQQKGGSSHFHNINDALDPYSNYLIFQSIVTFFATAEGCELGGLDLLSETS